MPKSYWETVPGRKIPSSLELYPVIHSYLQKSHKILDIGCGFGKISLELASLGYSVMGIDINTEVVKLSEAAAKSLELDRKTEGRAEFKVGNASALPFRESSFNFAIMQAFLTSVPDPQERVRIIQEAFRVLKPESYLYLAEFGQNWHLEPYRKRYLEDFPVTKEEGSFLALNPETGEVEFIAHHFSEKELVFLLVDCGFEIDYFRVEELKTKTGNKINGFIVVAKKL
ncbi:MULTISPECIES: class I SAM-dependent methyltransferase [unclassified Methanosarcina]|uniref:class I SAM-dependent methyltransferase n=1 Tax=unclassified Methanosarcina TaxID=2644672 RepID=UPI0006161E33|nr:MULTISPECIES: class I SAM-dependent methyltransferase [unclassified Methanosarcina]AKB19660.1 SAM-dependent methyltransferase [Methanosarcina sp. WWM596]AKB22549.1 SAM-dependent methyltransferase [Methanosarcina sp. WH1]